mmetsp:Transcript_89123/g.230012  ORF Transcript_89123/g.230012 Transcript_89123/m.230012 type:complete len:429 (+) Transcript_89123:100-1386(+)
MPEMLVEKIPCAPSVDNFSAISNCESAASECGFRVVSRTKQSLVLLPTPQRRLLCCWERTPANPDGTKGVTAEVGPNEKGDGLVISVATPRDGNGEKFVQALSRSMRLERGGPLCSATTMASPRPPADESKHSAHFKVEAQAYYSYSRILADAKQAPGLAAAEFVQTFTEKCVAAHSPGAGEEFRPIAACSEAVARLCKLVEEHTKNEVVLNDLKPWLRFSVERAIYRRVGGPLWRFYEERHGQEDACFVRRKALLGKHLDSKLFDALGLDEKFRGKDVAGLDADQAASCEAYAQASTSLSQVEVLLSSGGCTPREALELLMTAQIDTRTCAFEAANRQSELHADEDVVPALAFVVVRSKLRRPFACAHFLADALAQKQGQTNEEQAVRLLSAVAKQVAYDWQFDGTSLPSFPTAEVSATVLATTANL